MKKQIVQLLIFGLLAITITACGGSNDVPAATAVAVENTTASSNEEPMVATATSALLSTGVSTSSPTPEPEPTEAVEPIPTVVAVVEPTAAEAESEPVTEVVEEVPVTTTFQLEAWADNWFAAYLGEELIVEDSVSITTERSFNAETATFEASYPLTLNFILKDFKENDTGLEYIGERNQQMGDGGFIMQLTDTSTGEVVAVSDSSFACLVIHEAPLDKSCENEANPVAGIAPCEFVDLGEPEGWKAAEYDDSAWTATTVHSAAAVGPKGGYDDVTWNESAEFIWGPDLETDNTLLCRVTISKE